ncbi:MAG: hypothetical protein ACR2QH_18235 [Geminicoccaceae bacterium]
MANNQTSQNSMTGDTKLLSFGKIIIDDAKILRIQGYRDLQKVRPVIKRVAAAAARETETLIQSTAYFRNLDVYRCENGVLVLSDGTVFENEAFERFFGDVKQVVVFILSMGHPLDQAIKSYIADDQLLNALFMETAGWLGIEAATKQLSRHLKPLAEQAGCRLSPRLGPGYSYKLNGRSVVWPLEQQHTLFELFKGQTIDVELLESSAMLPKISRSGVFGFISDRETSKI